MSRIHGSILFHFSLPFLQHLQRRYQLFPCLRVTLSEETGREHWQKRWLAGMHFEVHLLALFAIREGSCWVPLVTSYFELTEVATPLECGFLLSYMEIWWPSTWSVGYPAGHMERTRLFGALPGSVPWRSSFFLFTNHEPSLHTIFV